MPASEFLLALTNTMNLIFVYPVEVRASSAAGVPFVNADAVAVGIKDHRHAANRRGHRLDAELHLVLFQMRDRSVEILHFERGAAAIRTWLECRRATDGQRVRTKLIFGPLTVFRVSYGRWREVQNAFVECTSALHVSDRVTAECQFDDLHMNLRLFAAMPGRWVDRLT
jgi:hypothetical protein